MHIEGIGGNAAADPWFESVVDLVGDRNVADAWVARLPPGYRDRNGPDCCAADLAAAAALEVAPTTDPGAVEDRGLRSASQPADPLGQRHLLRVRPAGEADPAAFRLRRIGTDAVELTAVLPVLESFGLAVIEAVPLRVEAIGGHAELHIDDFGVRVVAGAGSFVPSIDGSRLVAAVDAVASGLADIDDLNRLVIAAGLDWRQVIVLRAFRRYRRQCATAWSDAQLDEALAGYPEVARDLVGYFEARFAPGAGSRDPNAARDGVRKALANVPHLDQDEILRDFLGLVDATLRTNWYIGGGGGGSPATIAVKLDSRRVPGLAPPKPHVEAFVHGPIVEGIHLRMGPIARGGIRWSDRPVDLRTEILGLAEAQTKKNAIIVPTGAKGGFVVRRRDGSGAVGAYREFISCLLDITDTIVAGAVRNPAGVKAGDGDDPYLVVAADRGTATFSDDANALSAARRFWLGDAFASGGSHGYDHKAMGITARGAWVAVRRHFHQLGIDVQEESIRVVGVGDMSGDVFGNGMLQSRAIKLVAAFHHRHVFIDPDPDPTSSYAERARLAGAGRSTWADYDRDALSAGGGVWPRDAKVIALSTEARAALGVTQEILRPPELISAMLAAPVDLLWFGGIGTFVKAPDEPDVAVGDHTNDGVRVTTDAVRARVIAEGGNLGVTQRGRIRFSRRGGRINADFIDNAAGVATSDREVNLKILLALAVEAGRFGAEERNRLLADAAGEVTAAVLGQVDHSVAALDRSVPDSARSLDAYEALLVHLETAGLVDRDVESLPGPEELASRRDAGAGLIRPELAVLLAYAKSDLVGEIESSPLTADPSVLDAVVAYFPAGIRARAGDLVAAHRLYPQLVATALAGELVDFVGLVWANETAAELGRDFPDVVGAFWAARQVLGAGGLWHELAAAASAGVLDADGEAVLHGRVAEAVSSLARSYLRRAGPVVPSALIAQDGACGVDGGVRAATVVAPASDLTARVTAAERRAAIGEQGPVARATRRPLGDVAAAFAAFDALASMARLAVVLGVPASSRWAAWQARALSDDLAELRSRVVVEALAPAGIEPEAAIGVWATLHQPALDRAARLAGSVDPASPSALTVAALAVRILRSS